MSEVTHQDLRATAAQVIDVFRHEMQLTREEMRREFLGASVRVDDLRKDQQHASTQLDEQGRELALVAARVKAQETQLHDAVATAADTAQKVAGLEAVQRAAARRNELIAGVLLTKNQKRMLVTVLITAIGAMIEMSSSLVSAIASVLSK